MNMLSFINPITVSITTGFILSVGLLIALWKCSQQIKTAIQWVWQHVFNWTCFYWVVNLVCMAFSAQNAGYIFGLYENTGILVGIALDMLIIAFTQAMLAAKARGERSRAAKILLFIVFCCLLSTAGNLAHNLHTDIAGQTHGVWFSDLIPYLVSTMPLFLIALAWVADLKVNPIESMDINQYKANEEKHLDFLEIQIDNREEQAKLDQRMIVVESLERRNKQLRKGKAPRSFRWPWEPKIDVGYIVSNVADNMKIYYEERIAEAVDNYQQKIEEMQRLSNEKQAELEAHIQGLLGRVQQGILQENEVYRRALAQQYDQDLSLLQGRVNETLSALQTTGNAAVNTDEMSAVNLGNGKEKAEPIEEIIELDEETKAVIARYPIVVSWLSRSPSSVSLPEIVSGTKHTHQRVNRAAREGAFQGTRREGYYRLKSVINWLKTAPLPKDNKAIINEVSPALSNGNQANNRYTNGHKEVTSPLDNFIELEV